MEIAKAAYKLTRKLPKEEKYGLSSQAFRAAVSIPSNIAEGCSRTSQLDFKRFLEIALGSAFELETQLMIASELGIAPPDEVKELTTRLNLEQKMINTLISKIKAKG